MERHSPAVPEVAGAERIEMMSRRNSNSESELIEDLILSARSILHHDASEAEPQDIWEIEQLRKAFTRILHPRTNH